MNPHRKNTSRRNFLLQVSLGSAAVLSGAGFASQALAQAVSTKPQKKLGVALLGLGGYATNNLRPALAETTRCQLVGVVSGHPQKAAKWAKNYSLPAKNIYNYENFDGIADNPDIDIVYVVTPNALHREFVVRAAKAGKHVICEKPMATSVADCEAMIAACKDAKVKLSLGYRMHFDPYAKELMRLQRDGDFGPLKKLSGDFSFVINQRVWRVDKKLAGGGPLMDVGIYVINAACMAAGAAPVAVTAREDRKERPEFFVDIEETLRFRLEFSNGAVCNAVTSYNHYENTFRAEGDKGWIDFQDNAFSYQVGTVLTSKGPLNFPAPNQQALQMDDFVDCIQTGRVSEVGGEMGLRDMKIITAIYEAARTGKRVTV